MLIDELLHLAVEAERHPHAPPPWERYLGRVTLQLLPDAPSDRIVTLGIVGDIPPTVIMTPRRFAELRGPLQSAGALVARRPTSTDAAVNDALTIAAMTWHYAIETLKRRRLL